MREGRIRFVLREGKSIEGVACDASKDIEISGREATIRVGYTWCNSTVTVSDGSGQRQVIHFNTMKLNNWNRIEYREEADGSFLRLDNGVVQRHQDVIEKP